MLFDSRDKRGTLTFKVELLERELRCLSIRIQRDDYAIEMTSDRSFGPLFYINHLHEWLGYLGE